MTTSQQQPREASSVEHGREMTTDLLIKVYEGKGFTLLNPDLDVALFNRIINLERVAEATKELLADLEYLDIQVATIGEMRQALSILDPTPADNEDTVEDRR